MHIWLRAEERPSEQRTPLLPDGARELCAKGWRVTVEDSPRRVFQTAEYKKAGCDIQPAGAWTDAPDDAIILGLKELPANPDSLRHHHIFFGHAYKGQANAGVLLRRFKRGEGALYDMEYLTDENGRRVAAFGYWAGFAGAGVSILAYAAAQDGALCPSVAKFQDQNALISAAREALGTYACPKALIIGGRGRVGAGVLAFCEILGIQVTLWDRRETQNGVAYENILSHDMFFNCILAGPGTPIFLPQKALSLPRNLKVIGDIACDPQSEYNPIPLYNHETTWQDPVVRVADAPILDIMAIDNLPSLLPKESSEDFAAQLFPFLQVLDKSDQGVWQRARKIFDDHSARV